jgi:hypothetical protein
LRLRARPAEYGMNVDHIVALPTPNDQAPASAFAQVTPTTRCGSRATRGERTHVSNL